MILIFTEKRQMLVKLITKQDIRVENTINSQVPMGFEPMNTSMFTRQAI